MKDDPVSDDIHAICKETNATLVYQSESDGMHIEVLENKHYRWLKSGTQTVHSAMNLSEPWKTVLPYSHDLLSALSCQKKTDHILLLGLGGGELVRYLQHALPNVNMTVLEKNSMVIDVYQQYFNPERTVVDTICADLCEWDAGMSTPQDMVFLDVYGDGFLPECLYTEELYKAIFNLLAEDGILAANFAVRDEQDAVSLLVVIRKVFTGQVLFLAIEGHKNLIVMAFRGMPDATSVKQLSGAASWTSL